MKTLEDNRVRSIKRIKDYIGRVNNERLRIISVSNEWNEVKNVEGRMSRERSCERKMKLILLKS